ncbi:Uma2 family endonuclease [Tolypothrix sp. VBCCA 56010]|uniref:Uma2 family endonuclease n=1 Tax=Tolypothrix sp. VBCCA 56010 TaxID=3137731 RepID=UPI003D7E26D3
MEVLQIALPSTLKLNINLTDEQYFQLCEKNRDYRFERTAEGELLIMPPTGSDTGRRNVKITTQLDIWNSQNNLGEVFDSSTGFTLPNGAKRSPDASWVKIERWNALTPEQQESFAPICPDFVIELRSRTDSLKELQDKMQEYIDNGANLGWLIDRKNKQVEIYRPGKEVEILENPAYLSGEDVLPGFVLNLMPIL